MRRSCPRTVSDPPQGLLRAGAPWFADLMAFDDKMDNKKDDLGGKAKEAVGNVTGDDELKAQGKGDQAKSDIKQAGEKIKDAFKK